MGDAHLLSRLDRLAGSLAGLNVPGASPVFVDRIEQLRQVLQRMRRVSAGELRIVALGSNASLKSTTLRLLLGRDDILAVGPGAVSAVATELRLVQADGPDTAPVVFHAVTLTEEGARRRARRILGVEDEYLSLEEMGRLPHQYAFLVQEMADAARRLGHNTTIPLTELAGRGGSITFNDGPGSALIARVSAEVTIPADEWKLSWADGRTVVLIDTPGTRKGSVLEDVVIAEMESRAHIALLTMACGGGATLVTPRVAPDPHCVFVTTRLDAVDNPHDPNSLHTLETAVAAIMRELRDGGRPGRDVRVAATSGPWAAADPDAWRAFDPNNEGIWKTAQVSKEQWGGAAWDPSGATNGELRRAVDGALADGGVTHLRGQVEALASKDTAHIDAQEFDHLVQQGLELFVEAGTSLPSLADASKQREQAARGDARPLAELRRIAREQADIAVYSADEWSEVRLTLTRGDGPSPSDVVEPLNRLDVAGLTADALAAARVELATFLRGWWKSHTDRPFDPALFTDAMESGQATEDAGTQLDTMAKRLLHQLAGRPRTGAAAQRPAKSTSLHFRQVARVREDLARLLERRLIDMFEPEVVRTQRALSDLLHKQRLALAGNHGPIAVLNVIGAELQQLSTARTGGAE
ncbi:P-loop NTPase family protein [Streptomyces spongiae]|uniref:Dynamin family protein n=1 Tax=Streptomyces spongiae TaxID=565072 RepID=A0A5N8XR53_9ACTN|nr:hypothetical protein [Streptomyces spongiae]MPY61448.1 hypothetical protein [Streptomyces spongiae]